MSEFDVVEMFDSTKNRYYRSIGEAPEYMVASVSFHHEFRRYIEKYCSLYTEKCVSVGPDYRILYRGVIIDCVLDTPTLTLIAVKPS